jgi:hypothetical protein
MSVVVVLVGCRSWLGRVLIRVRDREVGWDLAVRGQPPCDG